MAPDFILRLPYKVAFTDTSSGMYNGMIAT